MTLSEDEQLLTGNAFMRRLAEAMNPESPALGHFEVIKLMDAGKSLSAALNLDLTGRLYVVAADVSGDETVREAGDE